MTANTRSKNKSKEPIERPERVSFIYEELQFYPKEDLIDLLVQTHEELDALKRKVKNND